MKAILTIMVLMLSFSTSFAKDAVHTCRLEVSTDDGVDLSPDDWFVMKDQSGKELRDIPLKMFGSVRSGPIIAEFSPISVATADGQVLDGVELSVGVEIPGFGIVASSETKTFKNQGTFVKLDLRGIPSVRDSLGAKYQGCESDKGCHSNVVILSCE